MRYPRVERSFSLVIDLQANGSLAQLLLYIAHVHWNRRLQNMYELSAALVSFLVLAVCMAAGPRCVESLVFRAREASRTESPYLYLQWIH
jgi:hypothetical protein